MTVDMAWALVMFGPAIIIIVAVFIAVGIEMHHEGIGWVELKKPPIIPKQPSITRCMEYVSKWDDEDKPEEYKPRVRTESLFNIGDGAVIEITGTPSQFKNFDACRNELVEASTSLHLLCAELVLSALNYGFTVELRRR